ncbi:hypothetical protein KFE25_002734 [Diacronema lutheri]|uniref:CS domain-containing protein n=1 Tax=Diacronema lutheri TaxID=2081491 RepID=A0A8J6C8I5_DIALT|nr:hypothetical protein KFE25_002734 [Diacronema lutheri]
MNVDAAALAPTHEARGEDTPGTTIAGTAAPAPNGARSAVGTAKADGITARPAPLIWHQTRHKVLVNCVLDSLRDVDVDIDETCLALSATHHGQRLAIDVPLRHEVDVGASHWFASDREVVIVLAKKAPLDATYWMSLTEEPALKKWVRPDLINWLEEDDVKYASRSFKSM